jgi:homoserine dehydrogenase
MTKLKIGLFGFGCVGQGLYDVLTKSKGFKADIVKIGVKNQNKHRSIDASFFTYDKFEILNNPEINVIIELIDDAEEAYNIVSHALKSGKHVVTANKKMVATHLEELVDLQHKYNVSLLYEASSCGSIPIIRTLEEYYDNEQLNSISGIFNGTSNFILTKTIFENLNYADALQQAQELGFAETDPTNDVAGFDSKFKAIIIASHAFGLFAKPDDVLNFGIETLSINDVIFAKEKQLKLKLIPTIKKQDDGSISVFVLPQFVNSTNYLFNVENEFNGVIVEGVFSGKQFLSGKGAGGHPTGSAVLSDISALSYGYRYEYKKQHQNKDAKLNNDVFVKIYLRYLDDAFIKELSFSEILVKHNASDLKYIIGVLPLKKLIQHKDYILKNKLFIALTEDALITPVTNKETILAENPLTIEYASNH